MFKNRGSNNSDKQEVVGGDNRSQSKLFMLNKKLKSENSSMKK